MTQEIARDKLPDAPEGAFDYLAGLTEESDLSINDRHFKNSGGVAREWFCPETGGQCAVFSVTERISKGVFRFQGAHITDANQVMSSSSFIERVGTKSSTREEVEPANIEEMLQILKGILSPSRRSRVYRINKKPQTLT